MGEDTSQLRSIKNRSSLSPSIQLIIFPLHEVVVAAGMRFYLWQCPVQSIRMNRSFFWIALIIALCFLALSAPAGAAPGTSPGQSHGGDQGSSGGMAPASPGQVMGSQTTDADLPLGEPLPGSGPAGLSTGRESQGNSPASGSGTSEVFHGTGEYYSGGAAGEDEYRGQGSDPVWQQGTASGGKPGTAGDSLGSPFLQGGARSGDGGEQGGGRSAGPAGSHAGAFLGQNSGQGHLSLIAAMVSGAVPAGASGRQSPPGGNQGGAGSPHRQQHDPSPPSGRYPCGPAQTSPLPVLPGPSQTPAGEEPTPRLSRSRRPWALLPETDPLPQGSPAPGSPASPLFSLSLLLFGGYRRVSRKNVLGHAARSTLYREIVRRPGSDTAMLAEATGINENTLRYHLMKLVETGTITTLSRPGVVRYFPNQGKYSLFEQLVIHYTRTATPCAILELLSIHPGMTRQDLADALALSGPSVSRQMFSLIDDGIVENRSDGRSNHYFLTKDAYRALKRLADGEPVLLHPAHTGENYPCHREETARGPVAALALDRPRIPGI